MSSSNFPRFDRNLNTGHELGADAEMLPAMQTIFHDREHPSRLVLPIVPRKHNSLTPTASRSEGRRAGRMRGTHPGRSRFQPRFLLPIRRIGLPAAPRTGRSPASPRLPWLLPARLPSLDSSRFSISQPSADGFDLMVVSRFVASITCEVIAYGCGPPYRQGMATMTSGITRPIGDLLREWRERRR